MCKASDMGSHCSITISGTGSEGIGICMASRSIVPFSMPSLEEGERWKEEGGGGRSSICVSVQLALRCALLYTVAGIAAVNLKVDPLAVCLCKSQRHHASFSTA